VEKQPCVHILASGRSGARDTGVTSDVIKRVYPHKHHVIAGVTDRYRVDDLVWFECHASMETAIRREKAITQWRRNRKIRLIEDPIRNGGICIPNCCDQLVLASLLRGNDGSAESFGS